MGAPSPSKLIDRYIASIGGWQGERMAQVRRLMHEADPDIVEEWKWMGTPTWSHDGVVAVAGPMKEKVKVTFSRGAHLPDPHKVFNNGLGGKEWRALDIFESDSIKESALREIIREAVKFNRAEFAAKARSEARPAARRSRGSPKTRQRSS